MKKRKRRLRPKKRSLSTVAIEFAPACRLETENEQSTEKQDATICLYLLLFSFMQRCVSLFFKIDIGCMLCPTGHPTLLRSKAQRLILDKSKCWVSMIDRSWYHVIASSQVLTTYTSCERYLDPSFEAQQMSDCTWISQIVTGHTRPKT